MPSAKVQPQHVENLPAKEEPHPAMVQIEAEATQGDKESAVDRHAQEDAEATVEAVECNAWTENEVENEEAAECADEVDMQLQDSLEAAAADSAAELQRLAQQLRETEAALAALEEDCSETFPDDEEAAPDAADAFQVFEPTPAPRTAWPGFGEAWPLRGSASSLAPAALRRIPVPARRAVSGGCSPNFAATAALCDCISAEGHDVALLALQRLYAWLWSTKKAEVQDWLEQLSAHASLVDLLSCPGKSLAIWTCYVIASAALDHARNAKAFAEANATAALQAATARYAKDPQIAAAVTFAFAAYLPKGRK